MLKLKWKNPENWTIFKLIIRKTLTIGQYSKLIFKKAPENWTIQIYYAITNGLMFIEKEINARNTVNIEFKKEIGEA